MINPSHPTNWRDLQEQVARILRECGLDAAVEVEIRTARGTHEIDVLARDHSNAPELIYFCECKHWMTAIPQEKILAFRSLVSDYGAHVGLIISAAGFQEGAFETAAFSNLKLLTWEGFEQTFRARWIREYFWPRLNESARPLIEYLELCNSRIARRVELLDKSKKQRLRGLREQHDEAGWFPAYLRHESATNIELQPVSGYLSRGSDGMLSIGSFSEQVARQRSLRGILDAFCGYADAAVNEFDDVFGGRV